MTTIADLETIVQYDLGDTGLTQFPQTTGSSPELVAYFNRAIRLLDLELANVESDFTLNEAGTTGTDLAAAANYIAVPTGTINVRDIWNGTTRLTKKPLNWIYYWRNSSPDDEGPPYYWAIKGATIQFERAADDDYATIVVYYDKFTGTLAKTGTVPYADYFNDVICQAVVMFAKNRNEQPVQIDAIVSGIFHEAVMGHVFSRADELPPYRLDF